MLKKGKIQGFFNTANTKSDKEEVNISYIITLYYNSHCFITQEMFLKQFYLNNTKINLQGNLHILA